MHSFQNAPFFQNAPSHPNLLEHDGALRAELRRRLPADVLTKAQPELDAMGKATADELPRLHAQADLEHPVHVPYSPWGVRVDEIRTGPTWDALKTFSATHGIVATGYESTFGPHRRVVQAAKIHLFSATSAVFSCPLAMTDAAAKVLSEIGPVALKDRLFTRLTTRDPERFITSGQWMTERIGGSDVSGTETIARPVKGTTDQFQLFGVKWFTSATTSEMALTLARIDDGVTPAVDGSRGLTLFAVDVTRGADGSLDGILVNRLKDKLGTRALPTAELTLDGVTATMLGERGRGVASIATMLNITRLHNTLASSSAMVKGAVLARAYASQRRAFGKNIEAHPLHANALNEMEGIAGGATALAFHAATLLGEQEDGALDDEGKRILRALIPIAKLTTGKQAVKVSSEALEAFGGAGYVEDSGIPRILRDAQVLPIWEGTTNVLSLDVLRAEAKEGAFTSLVKDIGARVERWPKGVSAKSRDVVARVLARVGTTVKDATTHEQLESLARPLALTTGKLMEAVLLAESCAHADDDGERRVFSLVQAELAGPLEMT